MRAGRSGRRSAGGVVLAAVVLTVGLTALGLWQRAVAGPWWPEVLTDWSLGAALLALSSVGVGGVIVIRLPRNMVGWIFLAMGVLSGAVFALRWVATVALEGGGEPALAVWPAWGLAWLIPLNMTLLSLLLLTFPFGAAPSRRWRVVGAGLVVVGITTALVSALAPYLPDQTPFPTLRNPTAVIGTETGALVVDTMSGFLLVGFVVAAMAIIVKLRRATGVERQQLKWFCFAAVVTVTTYIVGFWVTPLFVIATLLAFPAVPMAAGVAILRYRLYEIDRVISRTMTYGGVTVVVVAVYLGGIAIMTALTSPVVGDSPLTVAAATLAAAAVFGPARRKIQGFVDRRFNRARYDAAATVDRLRVQLRDDVDLESLKGALVEAVCATMHPAGTTLWLREAER